RPHPAGDRRTAFRAARHREGPHPPRAPETPRRARAPPMIDERHEELAALYALDLLEGADRAQFETALARDSALQQLVRELGEAVASPAHAAPGSTPPTALKARVLASATRHAPSGDNVVRPSPSVFRAMAPWAVAAAFAFAAAVAARLYVTARAEA